MVVPFHWTWRNTLINHQCILPSIKNQNDLHPLSCAHHAIAAAMESRKRKQWYEDEDRNGVPFAHEASVSYLVNNCGEPPLSAEDVIDYVNFYGLMSEGDYVCGVEEDEAAEKQIFELESYETLRDCRSETTQARLIEKLRTQGPFIGTFIMRMDYYDRLEGIYEATGELMYHPRFKGGPTRHTVCVVGYGYTEDQRGYWEYMDSVGDNEWYLEDGFGKIRMSGLEDAIVPIMKALGG